MLQPDLGTALVHRRRSCSACCAVVRRADCAGSSGLRRRRPCWSPFVAVQVGVLDDYQIDRFTAFTNPTLDPQGVGYNTQPGAASRSAPAGCTGKGLFHGTQTHGQFVPEQQTDFVFTVAGEELGFVGAGADRAAARASCCGGPAHRHARRRTCSAGWWPTGIVCWFAFQTFENIGMTLGIMPVTGVPLPFVSYGGSSMFANWMADRAAAERPPAPLGP